MNRHFLAGASALALLAGASAANAQFTVAVSGDTRVDFFHTDLETSKGAGVATNVEDTRNTDFVQRTRIVFTATQKTDSGLTYGWRNRVRIGAGGSNNSDAPVNADQSFIFINGAFGQVVLGQSGGAYDSSFGAADGWGTGGGDGSYGTGIGAGIIATNAVGASAKSLLGSSLGTSRIYYLTPEFSGFTAGVGYAPTVRNVGNEFIFNENTPDFNDVIEVMARYQTSFAGGRVELWAGYNFGQGKPGTGAANNGETEDLSAYAVAGRLTFGPARVSLHYSASGKSGQQKITAPAAVAGVTPAGVRNTALEDATSISAYAEYTVLPELTIGASYAVYTGAGDVNVAGKVETTVTSIGAAYTVAPGLTLRPELNFVDYENKELNARDYNGLVAIFRTLVTF
jgi:outer membrane protein OmpU